MHIRQPQLIVGETSPAEVINGCDALTYNKTLAISQKRKGIECIGVDDTKIIFADSQYVQSAFAGQSSPNQFCLLPLQLVHLLINHAFDLLLVKKFIT